MTDDFLDGCDICESHILEKRWPPPEKLAASADGLAGLYCCPHCDAYWRIDEYDQTVIGRFEAEEQFPEYFDELVSRNDPEVDEDDEFEPADVESRARAASPADKRLPESPRQQKLFWESEAHFEEFHAGLRHLSDELRTLDDRLAALERQNSDLLEDSRRHGRMLQLIFDGMRARGLRRD